VSPIPTPPAAEVDSRGFPWDARIHAATRRQNVDGRWRKRSDVPAATMAQIEAELRPPPPPSALAELTDWVSKRIDAGELTRDEFHDVVHAVTGGRSISALSTWPFSPRAVHIALVARMSVRRSDVAATGTGR